MDKDLEKWLEPEVPPAKKESVPTVSSETPSSALKTEPQETNEIGKIKWIAGTAAVSVLAILAGFYMIGEPKAEEKISNAVSKSITSSMQFANSDTLDFSTVLEKQPTGTKFTHIWGKENMKLADNGELKVFYPAGSQSPSSDPRGGGGFIYLFGDGYESAKLSYKVKFEKGFDFAKGGKLPGFCSGVCPRGGSEVGNGFSTRFMWRTNGDLELYAYVPDKTEHYGKSLWRGSFRFESGKYYKLEQTLRMNTPGKNDGTAIITVDGKEVFRDDTVKFRETADTKIDSMIFSTFFGGSDNSFATPKDTYTYYKDFVVSH